MDIFTEIQDKLDTKKFQKTNQSFGGGYICSNSTFETDYGTIFVKQSTNENSLSMFNGELESLKKIQETQTIKVPKQYFVVADPEKIGGALVLEYLNMKPIDNWSKLGSDLADLHLFNFVLGKKKKKLESWIGKPPKSSIPDDIEITIKKDIKLDLSEEIIKNVDYVEQFGFDSVNYCGRIPQNNEWHENWIEFYARNRLLPQINLVLENYGNRQIIEYWSELQLKIDKFFIDIENSIHPVLLHGDLWSGNIGQVDNTPVIFDPASFYGHSEYELSISKLFGGFSSKFYQEYFKKIPEEKGFKRRRELYTLFHLLNHWNHFGESYQNQSLQLLINLIKYDF